MRIAVVAAIIVGLATWSWADATQDWLLIPGKNAGPIRATTTEAQLVKLYGKTRVKREKFRVIADSDEVTTTAVWPQDPVRTAHVVWKEGQIGKVPAMVVVQGTSTRWSVPPGITLGTTLSTLEKLNGKPFRISGFGWDLGGAIDWMGGKMEKQKGLTLTVDGGSWEALSEAEKSKISGDVNVMSNDPAVRKYAPKVTRLIIDL